VNADYFIRLSTLPEKTYQIFANNNIKRLENQHQFIQEHALNKNNHSNVE